MGFTEQEKERRLAAAERRLGVFIERYERHAEKMNAAAEGMAQERETIAWLKDAPVGDDEDGGEA